MTKGKEKEALRISINFYITTKVSINFLCVNHTDEHFLRLTNVNVVYGYKDYKEIRLKFEICIVLCSSRRKTNLDTNV